MKAFVSWSSGKDSAFALHKARQSGIEIVGVLTTITEAYDRVAMHGVRHALLDRQIAALPMFTMPIPIRIGETFEHDGFAFSDLIPD